jgi:hypothetical protein
MPSFVIYLAIQGFKGSPKREQDYAVFKITHNPMQYLTLMVGVRVPVGTDALLSVLATTEELPASVPI